MNQTIPITEVKIGARHRKDLGDIEALAESIARVGLLHLPVVTMDYELVCGFRRLEAAKHLGWDFIEVRTIDPDDMLLAEHDENEARKDFTVSERVAIADAIKHRLQKRQGERTDQHKSERQPFENFREVGKDLSDAKVTKTTERHAAKAAGLGNETTYRQAATVIRDGTPALTEAMDRGKVSISAAAEVATLPEAEQDKVVAKGPEAVRDKAKEKREERRRKAEKQTEQMFEELADAIADEADDEPGGEFEGDDITPEPDSGPPPDKTVAERAAEKWKSALDRVRFELRSLRNQGGMVHIARHWDRGKAKVIRDMFCEARDELSEIIEQYDSAQGS